MMHMIKPALTPTMPNRTQTMNTFLTRPLAALWLASLLAACDTPTTPAQNPSPSPSASQTPIVTSTPVPVPRIQVQIQIQTADTKKVIPGAEVSLTSPTQETIKLTTDASGWAVFRDVPQTAEYTIDVTAPGYEGASRKANLSQLATLGQKALLLAVELNSVSSNLTGRVLDSNGTALSGATVFDTLQSVTTDSQGRFKLGYSTSSEVKLTVSKTGYQSTSKTVFVELKKDQDLGDISLTRRTEQFQVGIDTSHLPLGQSNGLSSFAGLQNQISSQGFTVKTLSSGLEDKLDSLDVLLLLCPSTSFSASEIGAIQAFVLSGHKLIVTGEWAGFSGFDGAATNQMLAPFKVQLGVDTLRENNTGTLNIKTFSSHPITTGISQLTLYQSGSVKITGTGSLVARTGATSFQIASNQGAFGVVSASTYGSGKVVVVGDTSFWSNEDSDGNGTPNINEADNLKLLQQILSW